MRQRKFEASAPFQSVADAARLTGLSQGWLRKGIESGFVPVVRNGRSLRVNVPALLRKLDAQALSEHSEGGDRA